MSDDKKYPIKPFNAHYIVTEEDIKELLENEEGFLCAREGDLPMRIPTETHMIAFASTGQGKGTSVAMPLLLDHKGSVVSFEIGGATLNQTINYRRNDLMQKVHVIDPFKQTGEPSARINLLKETDPDSLEFYSQIRYLAQTILKSPEGTKEQSRYWESNPAALLTAVLIYVRTSKEVEDEDRNLCYVADLFSTFPSEDWHDLMHRISVDTSPHARIISSVGRYFYGEKDENVRSIFTSVNDDLNFARDPTFRKIMKDSTFSLKDLRDNNTTVYIVMPNEKNFQTHAAWVRTFLETAFDSLPNFGDGGAGFKLNERVLFILDEFPNIGKLDTVTRGMQTVRQKGISICAIAHGIAQLEDVYGKSVTSAFLGASSITRFFGTTEERNVDYVAKRLGRGLVQLPTFQYGESISDSEARSTQTSEQFARTEGTTDTDTEANSQGMTETISDTNTDTYNHSTGDNSFSSFNWQSGHSGGSGRNSLTSRGNSKGHTVANARNQTRTLSMARGRNRGTTETSGTMRGTVQTTQKGRNFNIGLQPQIVPLADPAEIGSLIGMEDNQIIFVQVENKTFWLLTKRPRFHDIPELLERANTRGYKPSPLMLPSLERQDFLLYGFNATFDLEERKPIPVRVKNVQYDTIPPLSSRKKVREGDFSGPNSAREYGYARIAKDEADSQRITKARENELRVFLRAAGAIEQEGAEIRATVGSKLASANERWQSVNDYAESVSEFRDRLITTHSLLNKRLEDLARMEDVVLAYRDQLREDLQNEERFATDADYYREYLQRLHNHRARSGNADMPERGETLKRKTEGELTPAAQIAHMLNFEVTYFDGALPDVAPAPANPRQKGKVRMTVPRPATLLSEREVTLRDRRPRTLKQLDEEITARSRRPFLIVRRWRSTRDEPTLNEMKEARYDLIILTQAETHEAIEQNIRDQEDFQEWLSIDYRHARDYVSALDDHLEALNRVAMALKSFETQMDAHREEMNSMLKALNEANIMIEDRRIEIHNRMMGFKEWEALEHQTQLLLEDQSGKHNPLHDLPASQNVQPVSDDADNSEPDLDDHTSHILKPDDPGM